MNSLISSLSPKNRNNLIQYVNSVTDEIKPLILHDHLNGFNPLLENPVLEYVNSVANKKNLISGSIRKTNVCTDYIFDERVKKNYPNLNFSFLFSSKSSSRIFYMFKDYNTHPKVEFKNFLCSFNGSAHISRQLLTAILYKLKMFNPEYCSKNFTNTLSDIDGLLSKYTQNPRFYRKFFMSDKLEDFFSTVYTFGYNRFEHSRNIKHLENKLTQSFIHLVSESLATSYYPFITEKFLYSVVTRGLFLAYAQPNWHKHLEKYFGFRLYRNLFDYKFDTITDPVSRLLEIITMINKFNSLSYDELYDLYLIELENINYNFDHYYSGDFFKILEKI